MTVPSQAKRDEAAKSGHALPDGSYPINTVEDLKNAIHAVGRAKNYAKAKAHIIKRAKALGHVDLLPEKWRPVTASVFPEWGLTAASTRKWNPLLHPRGRDGKFIEKFGFVSWLEAGKKLLGQVRDIDGKDGTVTVRRVDNGKDVKISDPSKRLSQASKADIPDAERLKLIKTWGGGDKKLDGFFPADKRASEMDLPDYVPGNAAIWTTEDGKKWAWVEDGKVMDQGKFGKKKESKSSPAPAKTSSGLDGFSPSAQKADELDLPDYVAGNAEIWTNDATGEWAWVSDGQPIAKGNLPGKDNSYPGSVGGTAESWGLDEERFTQLRDLTSRISQSREVQRTDLDEVARILEVDPKSKDHETLMLLTISPYSGPHLTGRTNDGKDPVFSPERQALHDRVISEIIDRVAPPKEGETPKFIVMGGGPAAGKSSAIKAGLFEGFPNVEAKDKDGNPLEIEAIEINADILKESLPEVAEVMRRFKAGDNDPDAMSESDMLWATFAHEESSVISKVLIDRAQESGKHIVLDGTGDGGQAKIDKLTRARNNGYVVQGRYVTVDTEEAMNRANARGRDSFRFVPESIVGGTHASVSQVFEYAAEHLDDMILVDTGKEPPKVIASRKQDAPSLDVDDPEAYQKFLDKANEVWQASEFSQMHATRADDAGAQWAYESDFGLDPSSKIVQVDPELAAMSSATRREGANFRMNGKVVEVESTETPGKWIAFDPDKFPPDQFANKKNKPGDPIIPDRQRMALYVAMTRRAQAPEISDARDRIVSEFGISKGQVTFRLIQLLMDQGPDSQAFKDELSRIRELAA